jgi:hypothetical protein
MERVIHVPSNIDTGGSISIIRESIARALRTPIYTTTQRGMRIQDVNSGTRDLRKYCYIKVRFPGINRHLLVLALVHDTLELPFLLGANDQCAAHMIIDQNQRCVRIGDYSMPCLPRP